MSYWLVDGVMRPRYYSVVRMGHTDTRIVPDLEPGERFVECIGGHSYIVTEAAERAAIQAMQLDRTVDRCPSCGVDKMYFGCFCDRA